jgi:hypothetical protein
VTNISNNTTLEANTTATQVTGLWGGSYTFNHAIEIAKPTGILDSILDWCRTEMQDTSWRWQMRSISTPTDPGHYIFYFNNERDYLAFLLRWR